MSGKYQRLPEANAWFLSLGHEIADTYGRHIPILAAGPLREARDVFWDCMFLFGRAVMEPMENEETLKRLRSDWDREIIGFVGHAFHLFVSCWEDLLRGRYGAAFNDVRSLTEAPAYLLALHFDLQFREAWLAGPRVPAVARARDAAEKGLETMERGLGSYWRTGQDNTHGTVQVYSHLSAASVRASVVDVDGGTWVDIGGVIDPKKIVTLMGHLGQTALDFLWACSIALLHLADQPGQWAAKTRDVLIRGDQAMDRLHSEQERINAEARKAGHVPLHLWYRHGRQQAT